MSSTDESTMKRFLTSFALILIVQTGSLLWFLSSEHTDKVYMKETLARIEPQHNELWFDYEQRRKEK